MRASEQNSPSNRQADDARFVMAMLETGGGDRLRVTYIGHATLLIHFGDVCIIDEKSSEAVPILFKALN